MKTALVLFAGAGLSSIGLRQAGWKTVDVELNPIPRHMAKVLHRESDAEFHLMDIEDILYDFMEKFDAIWASPPCQLRSSARTQGDPVSLFAKDYLEWSLNLVNIFPKKTIWVENVMSQTAAKNTWGTKYNAHQFGVDQGRNRMIGGNYPAPKVLKEYKRAYPGICPAILATEHKGSANNTRRASRFYGRKLTMYEVAYHMSVPDHVAAVDLLVANKYPGLTDAAWRRHIYEGLGNGVPCGMAKAFGEAAL